MTELQHENRELRRELAQLQEDVQGMKTELNKKQDRPRPQRDFGNYDPMEMFENRDAVFRTDNGPRHPSSPHRRPPKSPKQANRSTRKGRSQQAANEDQDKFGRRAQYSSNHVRRSFEKERDLEAAAVSQW